MGQLNRIRSSAARWLRCAAQTGAELVYPPRCAFCREEILGPADGILLCSPCRKSLTAGAHAACPRCALSIEGQATIPASTCTRCREADWKFGAAVRLGRYRDELREAILRMKRPSGEPLASAIGKLLSESRCDELVSWRAEVVLPIPMHWRRRLSRGANSPDLLAAVIARRLGIPAASALARRRLTHPQNELPPEDRVENIRGAFRIKPSWDFSGARVLLVDDVMTTGATANEAAGVLRRGGASDVAIAVVARAEARDFS
ncbi:MAG TPA: ComF family protein [Pirellulales bacterium]|jgi:ComF family protein|nr:ComF family protein [Pirellulales bacterium]